MNAVVALPQRGAQRFRMGANRWTEVKPEGTGEAVQAAWALTGEQSR
jgi:hypothetical protein